MKYASLDQVLRVSREVGITSVGLWREDVVELGLGEVGSRLNDSGLRFSSLCRGGFFTSADAVSHAEAIADNRRAIDETAFLAASAAPGSAPVLVLVAGGLPSGSTDLIGARQRVRDAIGELEPVARNAGVTLAIEALHPMYAADRSVISTLGQALDIAEQFASESVGIVVDTFHVWWDPQLDQQIDRAGSGGRIASYQVSDWVTPLANDVLLSRGMMGDGHIDFGPINDAVGSAGFSGDIEVEVFNQAIWDSPPSFVAHMVVQAFNASMHSEVIHRP